MPYVQKIVMAAAAALIVVLGCASVKNNTKKMAMAKQDPAWAKIDSLSNLGQYAAALKATDALLAQAQAKQDWRTEFRAWMYKGRFMQYTGTEQKDIVTAMETRAATAQAPLKQLLHSVVAEQWWNYYQQNRWQILARTNMAEPTSDPDTWDQATFMRKVIAEYAASLQPGAELEKLPVGELGALLELTIADTSLRPTLFDVLAHRALEVFKNSETRLAEPMWRFQLDDARVFSPAMQFATANFTHRDSTAWHWQALCSTNASPHCT